MALSCSAIDSCDVRGVLLRDVKSPWTAWGIVFIVVLGLYAFTCAPSALWQDSGMIQCRLWRGDIEGRFGLALAHPLFYLLAMPFKYLPLGEYGYRINFACSIFSAVAVANLFVLLILLTGRLASAIVGTVCLAVSHTFWQHAVVCETYNLYVALMLFELIVLFYYFQREKVGYLYLLALLNGLAVSDHMLGTLALACYTVLLFVLLLKKRIRFIHLFVAILVWGVGALPYEVLIIRDYLASGDVRATLASAAFGNAWQSDVLNTAMSGKIVKENILFLGMNFPTPVAFLAFLGLYGLVRRVPRRGYALVVYAMLVLFLLFAFRYTVADRYAFFIPFYAMTALMIGVGADVLLRIKACQILAGILIAASLLPVAVYAKLPAVAKARDLSLGTKRDIPYRDDYSWFLSPWKTGYRETEQFADAAFESVSQGGVSIIIADGTTVYPLWYMQTIRGWYPEVYVLSTHAGYDNPIEFPTKETLDALLETYAIYVVTNKKGYCPDFIMKGYRFEAVGCLWRVLPIDPSVE